MLKIDLQHHQELAQQGMLSIQKHEQFPLLIHNYTSQAQYERLWIPATMISRGLITDLKGNIVARPFPKFFNLDEHISLKGPLPQEDFDVFEKMDGSMGVLYFWEDKPYVATRGSFQSEQALVAMDILNKKYPQVTFDQDYTYVFEIIYPENRIVVDYGRMHDLVLLGKIHTKSGEEAPLEELGIPLVKQYHGYRDLQALKEINEDNREGFVVRFKSGLRVKVKFEEYCRLHKVLTGVTKRTIWEYMKDGLEMAEILDKVPDEFYNWVKGVKSEFESEFKKIEEVAKSEFKVLDSRKETAFYFKQCTYPHLLFKMLDEKPYKDAIWRMLYPEHVTPFMKEN